MLWVVLVLLGVAACSGEPSGSGGSASVDEAAVQSGATSAATVRQFDASTQVQDPAPAKTATSAQQTLTAQSLTVQLLTSDMNDPHAMLAHGVNPSWGWGSGPKLGLGNVVPSAWTAPTFVPWGIAATAASGSAASNVRVQIRKLTTDVKRSGVWQRISYSSTRTTLAGAIYTDYETNAVGVTDIRAHDADGFSVKLPQSGGSFHFYSSDRFPIVPTGIQGVVVKFEARLIVDDPARPDDRQAAQLVALSGGDYWRSMAAVWDPGSYSNDDFAIGRFHKLGNDWQLITSHSLRTDADLTDYVNAESRLSPR